MADSPLEELEAHEHAEHASHPADLPGLARQQPQLGGDIVGQHRVLRAGVHQKTERARVADQHRDRHALLGVWLGGYLYDRTGSYDVVWYIAIALGAAAALVNLPIREQPIHRASPAGAPA